MNEPVQFIGGDIAHVVIEGALGIVLLAIRWGFKRFLRDVDINKASLHHHARRLDRLDTHLGLPHLPREED